MIPKTYKECVQIDNANQDTVWQDAVREEVGLAGGAVVYKSKLQETCATSSTEVELIAGRAIADGDEISI